MKNTVYILFNIFFANIIIICNAYSQYQNVLISNNNSPNETSIMINPFNSNIIVAGSNILYNPSISTSAYYFSTNSGLNWNGGNLISSIAKPHGDPVILVDINGNFYYLGNTNYGIPPPNLDKLLIQKSTDNGATWSDGTALALNSPKMDDKPWGCIDLTNSIYRNNIYVTNTVFDLYGSHAPQDSTNIMFYRSTDEGATFTTAKRLNKIAGNCYDNSNTVEGAMPCIGPNGEIFVSWSGQLGIEFTSSTDGGVTWPETNIHAADQVGGWGGQNFVNPINNFPVIVCDISSGPHRGTIYINFIDQRSGDADQDVWLIKSADGGNSWSQPKRVNNDPPGKNQFLTWLDIDRVTGYLYFVFYDKRNYSNTGPYADIFIARSTDGGETFQNLKINSSTIRVFNIFGEYISISAYNNKIRPMWTNSDDVGHTSVWTAIVDTFLIGIVPISTEIPNSFELFQNYPNPFNPVTKIKFDIPTGILNKGLQALVQIKVYDITGREVETILNEELKPGTYEVDFDGTNYPSGVYFYRLVARQGGSSISDYVVSKKMVLLK